MSQIEYSLFVSSVEGRTVFRFGSKQLIGAKRRHVPALGPSEQPASRPRVTVWDPKRIVAITAQEHRAYLKEYTREINDGALIVRKREEWEAQCAADEQAEKKARDAADKAEKAKAAKSAAETP